MMTDTEVRKLKLKMNIAQAKRDIKSAKEVSDKNISFMKYVEGFHLMVNVGGKKVPVNSKTVCFYEDNQQFIKARIASLQCDVESYEREIEDLEKKGE